MHMPEGWQTNLLSRTYLTHRLVISGGTDGERQKGKKEEWNRKATTKARALLSEGYDKLK